jgi:cytoskeletal protein CcmA (bactofilin family)
MFSKPKINDPIEPGRPEGRPEARGETRGETRPESGAPPAFAGSPLGRDAPAAPPPQTARKASASQISSDLTIVGNVSSTGDVQIDGTIEGDIRAHMLTIGEAATISGEILADDVVVHGHIKGRIRGVKIRLTSTARVEGDIIHKTIAIESGAEFEGSVQRRDDPLGEGKPALSMRPRPSEPAAERPKEAAPGQPPQPQAARSAG